MYEYVVFPFWGRGVVNDNKFKTLVNMHNKMGDPTVCDNLGFPHFFLAFIFRNIRPRT